LLTVIILAVPEVALFFALETPDVPYLIVAVTTGFTSVIWIEVVKWYQRRKR
jgi:riboflavin transporter FmnP